MNACLRPNLPEFVIVDKAVPTSPLRPLSGARPGLVSWNMTERAVIETHFSRCFRLDMRHRNSRRSRLDRRWPSVRYRFKNLRKQVFRNGCNINKALRKRLRVRAAVNGRSTEDEARDIQRSALSTDAARPRDLGQAISERFRKLGGVKLPLVSRDAIR